MLCVCYVAYWCCPHFIGCRVHKFIRIQTEIESLFDSIAAGANVNKADNHGMTPFHLAIGPRKGLIVQALRAW
jgi:hypothetical protein